MNQDNLLVGLDIGTSKVCAVIAELTETGGVDVLGVGKVKSKGLRRGVVVNIEATLRSVADAIEKAENMAGREIQSLSTGISGAHIEGINSRGVVAVTSKDREISFVDVGRVMDAARAVVLPMDREVLHVIPQEYVVDDQKGIRDPIDMIGVRLEAEVHIVTGSVTAAQNLLKCVNRAGFKVDEIALDILVASQVVLSQDEKDLGTIVIDIGGGTTNIILYQNGAPYFTGVVSIGGNEVTSDLSIILKHPVETMETLKIQSGCCYGPLVEDDPEEIILPGVGGMPPTQLTKGDLAEYIQPRMEEIFQLVKEKVEREGQFTRWSSLAGGIVLTGGGALLQGAPELAAEIFHSAVRVGYPLGVGGLVQDLQRPDLATAIGLVMHQAVGLSAERMSERASLMGTGSRSSKKPSALRKWFRNFFE
jgi:cell division protein FtsA